MQIQQDAALNNVRKFFDAKPLEPSKLALRFLYYTAKAYKCEFAIKGKDIIFHFFPQDPYPPKFLSNVTEAFRATAGEMGMSKISIDRVVDEAIEGGPISIFVLAAGFGENVALVDSLVPTVFDKLDAILAHNKALR
jgi:hypothetical protein